MAAHPDDDTIGCGGTMATIASRGGTVRVAYLTDGGASHPGSRRFDRSTLVALREREAVAALRELGVTSLPDFYRMPDAALGDVEPSHRAAVVTRLGESMRAFEPDAVVAPWRRDPHPDHIAAFELCRDAWLAAGVTAPMAGYDVWTAIHGRSDDLPRPGEAAIATIDIEAPARAAKRRALRAHRSQTSDLIDDDPSGFRISPELAERWLGPSERFFVLARGTVSTC